MRVISYNIARWYRPGWGRYIAPDPLATKGDPHPYAYARSNPLLFTDPTGEKSRVCCTPVTLDTVLNYTAASYFQHCFIEQRDNGTNALNTYSLHRMSSDWGCTFEGDNFDKVATRSTRTSCGPWKEDCLTDACVASAHKAYPNSSSYGAIFGSNSNSYASYVGRLCDLKPAPTVGWPGRTPGWGDPVAKIRADKKCPPSR